MQQQGGNKPGPGGTGGGNQEVELREPEGNVEE